MKKTIYSILLFSFLTSSFYAQEPDAATRKHLMELSSKYPVGLSRDSSDDGKTKVQRWILVRDKKTCATEYARKTYAWGQIKYFENGFEISKESFLTKTKQ
jgi:hypothetical protein